MLFKDIFDVLNDLFLLAYLILGEGIIVGSILLKVDHVIIDDALSESKLSNIDLVLGS